MEAKDLGFELAHVGINSADEAEGKRTADLLCELFGFSQRDGGLGFFVNEQFEVMKSPFRGRLGHIGIATSDITAAIAYLEAKGMMFDRESAKYRDGRMIMIYAQEEIAGFAFHLTQKA